MLNTGIHKSFRIVERIHQIHQVTIFMEHGHVRLILVLVDDQIARNHFIRRIQCVKYVVFHKELHPAHGSLAVLLNQRVGEVGADVVIFVVELEECRLILDLRRQIVAARQLLVINNAAVHTIEGAVIGGASVLGVVIGNALVSGIVTTDAAAGVSTGNAFVSGIATVGVAVTASAWGCAFLGLTIFGVAVAGLGRCKGEGLTCGLRLNCHSRGLLFRCCCTIICWGYVVYCGIGAVARSFRLVCSRFDTVTCGIRIIGAVTIIFCRICTLTNVLAVPFHRSGDGIAVRGLSCGGTRQSGIQYRPLVSQEIQDHRIVVTG